MDEFARPIWETGEDRLTARVKYLENEIQLGKKLMAASRLMLDAGLNDMEVKDAEIAQLKDELELTKKQRDQAIANGFLWVRGDWIMYAEPLGANQGAHKDDAPHLYAHLAGRGK